MLSPGLHFVSYDDGREANGDWEQDAVENTSGSHSELLESQGIRDQSPEIRGYISVILTSKFTYFVIKGTVFC